MQTMEKWKSLGGGVSHKRDEEEKQDPESSCEGTGAERWSLEGSRLPIMLRLCRNPGGLI